MLLLNACWVLVLATLANAARDLPTIPLGIPLPSQSPFNPEYHIASPQMEVLSADARIFLFRNFLSEAECDYIRERAEKRLTRSGVVDTKNGGSEINDIRTSMGMFFNRGEDPVIQAIDRRIANVSMTPVYHGEGLQVLRYEVGQKYEAHWDYFFDEKNAAKGANRYATMLTFLDTVEEGGETVFTKMPTPNGRDNKGFSECAKHHLAVKPHKGDAVLFHSMTFTGELEQRSMHGACPVIKGTKWSMAKWIHAKHYPMGDLYDLEAEAAKKPKPAEPSTEEF